MKHILTIILVIQLLLSSSVLFSVPAYAWFSKEREEKLDELIKNSKPSIPIFGEIKEPLKAGVSIFQYNPETIDLNNVEEASKEVIKLKPSESSGDKLSELEAKRQELQKAEEEGLNFIQPSLQLTEEEQKAIDEFFSRNEQEQLLTLWKATIERNKTIQFIIQKLTPTDSQQQANSLLSKSLGAAIFLPFYALQAFTNNTGAYYGSQVGGRILGSVVEGKMKKDKSAMQLSQTETIILFMMIDEVAERLRQRYHAYKGLMMERALATNELEESKKDSLDAHDSGVTSAEILAGIQRRSMEREIRRLDARLRSQKNALVELAGPQAVTELDQQLHIELAATKNTPLDF